MHPALGASRRSIKIPAAPWADNWPRSAGYARVARRREIFRDGGSHCAATRRERRATLSALKAARFVALTSLGLLEQATNLSLLDFEQTQLPRQLPKQALIRGLAARRQRGRVRRILASAAAR